MRCDIMTDDVDMALAFKKQLEILLSGRDRPASLTASQARRLLNVTKALRLLLAVKHPPESIAYWFSTENGASVPVLKGESKEDALKRWTTERENAQKKWKAEQEAKKKKETNNNTKKEEKPTTPKNNPKDKSMEQKAKEFMDNEWYMTKNTMDGRANEWWKEHFGTNNDGTLDHSQWDDFYKEFSKQRRSEIGKIKRSFKTNGNVKIKTSSTASIRHMKTVRDLWNKTPDNVKNNVEELIFTSKGTGGGAWSPFYKSLTMHVQEGMHVSNERIRSVFYHEIGHVNWRKYPEELREKWSVFIDSLPIPVTPYVGSYQFGQRGGADDIYYNESHSDVVAAIYADYEGFGDAYADDPNYGPMTKEHRESLEKAKKFYKAHFGLLIP